MALIVPGRASCLQDAAIFTHFDASRVERLFRAELLRVLVGKGLISQDVVDNLLSWRHTGFSAHGEAKAPTVTPPPDSAAT